MDKSEAQARLDRIAAFSSELAALERDGVLSLDETERRALAAYHERLVSDLTSHFDLDRGEAQRQMSLGMRAAAIVGAVALSASVYLFFYRIWGLLATNVQVSLLIVAPLAGVALTEVASRFDKSRLFVLIAACVAFACIVANVSMIGHIFAMTDSPGALLVWSAFALAIGYAYGLKLSVAGGLILAIAFLAGQVVAATGAEWGEMGRRPEAWLATALLLLVAGAVRPARRRLFASTYRNVGLSVALLGLWSLSINADLSALRWSETTIKASYQICGFVLAGGVIVFGLRTAWMEGVYLGALGLIVFLYTKFFQWWWDWMPAYLFFLIVGLVAIGMILLLRRVRALAAVLA
jgi:Predicted membrane protein (DUF2157)